MTKKNVEIENFSTKEVTDMFNFICATILNESPIEIKKSLLGLKTAKKDTSVTLSHLLTLIEKYNLDFRFRVIYIDGAEPAEKVNRTAGREIVENANGGLKTDPVTDAMESQEKEIVDPPLHGKRVFTEVTAGSEDQASDAAVPATFDPNAIPDFKP